MKQGIILMRGDVQEIARILAKFPGATYVEIEKDDTSGIGYTLKAAIPLNVDGTPGTFTVDLTDETNW